MKKEEVQKILDRIITPDGQGRPKKATMLLDLLDNENIEDIKQILQVFKTYKY